MSVTRDDYLKLANSLREITVLEGVSGLLGWDELVMLPENAAECRGLQKEVLAGILYDKKTSPVLGQLLESLSKNSNELSEVNAANVRVARKAYLRTTALPKDLVQKMAALETTAYGSWVAARKASDFSLFRSSLQAWVDANKQKAAFITSANVAAGVNNTSSAYDILLDDYETGMTSKRIDEVFAEVRAGLVPLIKKIRDNGAPLSSSWLISEESATDANKLSFDLTKQAALCREIALDLGFDINKGRLDVSVHPFTGGAHPTDVRMTTRFKVGDLTEGLTGAIHETGHALAEQNRNLSEEWRDQPVNVIMSMGIHESQSLFWERMVALGKPFQKYLFPKIQKTFPEVESLQNKTHEDFYTAINKIKDTDNGFIRVEADEVTYTMHIIIRFEIEQALVSGELSVDDVPRVWNQKMKDYLGVDVSDDAKGCLQDVHWAGGALGYFPTYSLGALYACQLYESALHDLPDLENDLAQGKFTAIREWLTKKVHAVGSFYKNGDELMIAATGKPLDPQVFLKYLTKKYTELYKL